MKTNYFFNESNNKIPLTNIFIKRHLCISNMFIDNISFYICSNLRKTEYIWNLLSSFGLVKLWERCLYWPKACLIYLIFKITFIFLNMKCFCLANLTTEGTPRFPCLVRVVQLVHTWHPLLITPCWQHKPCQCIHSHNKVNQPAIMLQPKVIISEKKEKVGLTNNTHFG